MITPLGLTLALKLFLYIPRSLCSKRSRTFASDVERPTWKKQNNFAFILCLVTSHWHHIENHLKWFNECIYKQIQGYRREKFLTTYLWRFSTYISHWLNSYARKFATKHWTTNQIHCIDNYRLRYQDGILRLASQTSITGRIIQASIIWVNVNTVRGSKSKFLI